MNQRQRETAKFFAGAFAYDAIMHLILFLSDALPLRLLGVLVTPLMNIVLMVAAVGIALLLAYHAWIKPPRAPFAPR